MFQNSLVVIPARGGSKGVPYKNIKKLNGKPLIYYTLDCVKDLVPESNICVSTDDLLIKESVEDYGIKVPFLRPSSLATDTAGSFEVILHALDFYDRDFENLILLQPTSPFRTANNLNEAIKLYHDDIDMVVSVKETKSNPYFTLFEEDDDGYLTKCKSASFTRRQDSPKVWEYNGAIYIINIKSLMTFRSLDFDKKIGYPMSTIESLDIDTQLDWHFAEFCIKEGLI